SPPSLACATRLNARETSLMTPMAQEILQSLPSLRRYARALTGSQQAGDRYVRVCLETLLHEPDRIQAGGDVKFQLFELFHEVLQIFTRDAQEGETENSAQGLKQNRLKQKVLDLPSIDRQVLLLVTLEGFSIGRAARLLRISEREAELRLVTA